MAGVLSGTSGDGIDVVLARTPPGRIELLAFRTDPWPGDLGPRVRDALDGAPLGVREVALLSRDLGLAFGAAARALADEEGLPLDLVGSHGLTVWHHDGSEPSGPATLQLGDGDHVAAAAGAPCASDFRQADIAAGGEGAPLSALADGVLFADLPRPAAILNLGGLANLTFLGEGEPPLAAFDTGPAGSLLDGLARRLLGRDFDEEGAVAAAGRPRAELAEFVEGHPFTRRPPPKSTGRDTFGEAFVDAWLARAEALGLHAQEDVGDLFASAVWGIAGSVALAIERFAPLRPAHLCLAGGGSRNRALVAALARRTGLEPRPSDAFGVPADAREGLVFAVLAARCAAGIGSPPGAEAGAGARAVGRRRAKSGQGSGAARGEDRGGDRAGVSGARPGAVLGKWSAPPPGTPRQPGR